MLLIGIAVGLLLGLLAGGRVEALVNVRLRYLAILLGAVFVRFATQFAIAQGVPLVSDLRLPLYAASFACLVAVLWLNRSQPGLLAVMVGVAANGIAMVVNGGWMPVYLPALSAAGMTAADLSAQFHAALPTELGLPFLLHAGPLGDVIPIPVPFLNNVASIGDIFISIGLGWFVFATLVHGEVQPNPGGVTFWSGPETEAPAAADEQLASLADRPVLLGSSAPGVAPAIVRGTAGPRAAITQRIRQHPYARLAGDARFSAFWTGQTISLFGDRLNQVALGVMVLTVTGSALETGLVFLAATLPNLILGPIAGPFVDRWNQKRVMVACDLLRAGLVLLIPVAGQSHILLVYPIVFLVTTVSLFFRPAKSAVVPRIVAEDELMAANGAIWTGETVADIAGYPLAGILVALLGTQFWVAFGLDAASYLISAALMLSIFIPPAVRTTIAVASHPVRQFIGELRAGWEVLRGQPALFQNTLVSAVAQLSLGTTLALTVVYARVALDGRFLSFPQNWSAMDAAMGVGNLLGGLAVGAMGVKTRKGWLVVIGFLGVGLATVMLGLTSNVLFAIAASFVIGVFNLVYVIPTQALFAELTPEGFMGRVVAFRSSLVLGALTLSMAVSSAAADRIPVGTVIAVSGAITVAAAIVAALLPAVRSPEQVPARLRAKPIPARAEAEDG